MTPLGRGWLLPVTRFWYQIGWAGVDLFFVLSGFLVSGLLFSEIRRTGSLRLTRFLIRRGFKIYPAFYVLILTTVTIAIIDRRAPLDRSGLVAEVLFVQNYTAGLWNHTWSLAAEEHFYLLLGLVVYGCGRTKALIVGSTLVPAAIAAVCCLVLSIRVVHALNDPYTESSHVFPTHLRIDSLLFGALLCYYSEFHGEMFQKTVGRLRAFLWVLAIAALLEISLLPLDHFIAHTFGFTLLYVGCGALMLVCLYDPIPLNAGVDLLIGGLAALGRYSYTIYLWHMPMKFWPKRAIETLGGVKVSAGEDIVLYLVSSIVVGILMARLIEFPALLLRDRLFKEAVVTLIPGTESISSRSAALPEMRDL